MNDKVDKPKGKLDELIELSAELSEYISYVADLVNGHGLSEANQKRAGQLYRIIGYKSGSLGKLVTELTNEKELPIDDTSQNMWNAALRIPIDKTTWLGAGFCYQVVNRAIGQFIEDARAGIRDRKTGKILKLEENLSIRMESPKAFIAHGGKSGVLDKLREFIQALGINPLIVELMPTQGMSIDDKVKKYMQEADCGIVLATRGGIIDIKTQKQHPRLNVIDELERLRAVFPDKTILLLEKGVDLPSNISGLTYEPFVRQSMDRAFTAIARELTAFGILKAMKPQAQEQS